MIGGLLYAGASMRRQGHGNGVVKMKTHNVNAWQDQAHLAPNRAGKSLMLSRGVVTASALLVCGLFGGALPAGVGR